MIAPKGGCKEIFVPHSVVQAAGFENLSEGTAVSYEAVEEAIVP